MVAEETSDAQVRQAAFEVAGERRRDTTTPRSRVEWRTEESAPLAFRERCGKSRSAPRHRSGERRQKDGSTPQRHAEWRPNGSAPQSGERWAQSRSAPHLEDCGERRDAIPAPYFQDMFDSNDDQSTELGSDFDIKESELSHSPSSLNWKSERYQVNYGIFKDIMHRLQCPKPEIDAFADAELHVLEHWWGPGSSSHQDAFSTSWGTGALLWMNPPYSLLYSVIPKLIQDEGRAILLVPHWPSELWLHFIMEYVVKRYFYPAGRRIFQDTGPTRWPVWALWAECFDKCNKFTLGHPLEMKNVTEEPSKLRTKAATRRWRRRWKAYKVC